MNVEEMIPQYKDACGMLMVSKVDKTDSSGDIQL